MTPSLPARLRAMADQMRLPAPLGTMTSDQEIHATAYVEGYNAAIDNMKALIEREAAAHVPAEQADSQVLVVRPELDRGKAVLCVQTDQELVTAIREGIALSPHNRVVVSALASSALPPREPLIPAPASVATGGAARCVHCGHADPHTTGRSAEEEDGDGCGHPACNCGYYVPEKAASESQRGGVRPKSAPVPLPDAAPSPDYVRCICEWPGDNPKCPIDHDQIQHERERPASASPAPKEEA